MGEEWTLPIVVELILGDSAKSKAQSHGLLKRTAKSMSATLTQIQVTQMWKSMGLGTTPCIILSGW